MKAIDEKIRGVELHAREMSMHLEEFIERLLNLHPLRTVGSFYFKRAVHLAKTTFLVDKNIRSWDITRGTQHRSWRNQWRWTIETSAKWALK